MRWSCKSPAALIETKGSDGTKQFARKKRHLLESDLPAQCLRNSYAKVASAEKCKAKQCNARECNAKKCISSTRDGGREALAALAALALCNCRSLSETVRMSLNLVTFFCYALSLMLFVFSSTITCYDARTSLTVHCFAGDSQSA